MVPAVTSVMAAVTALTASSAPMIPIQYVLLLLQWLVSFTGFVSMQADADGVVVVIVEQGDGDGGGRTGTTAFIQSLSLWAFSRDVADVWQILLQWLISFGFSTGNKVVVVLVERNGDDRRERTELAALI